MYIRMLYILLPNLHILISKYIECVTDETVPEPVISHSLARYLYEIKNKITTYGREWDIYKKYTNPYEYINSVVPNKSKCVSKYKPLSRSYFKMIEIIASFDLCAFDVIRSFHLAEGPGGFIEALVNVRRNFADSYVGMTLLDDVSDNNVPAWKKSEHFLRMNPNVRLENGATGTGDILSIANFDDCVSKYGSSMNIITADGGFDFSNDFNNQENHIVKLLFAQACYAICLQKKGGHFVLKIFDCFMEHTIDVLYILSAFYKNVYITKPNTSRYANSEKYIVCKNFLFTNVSAFAPTLRTCLSNAIDCKTQIRRFLTCPISSCYISKIEEYNAIAGQQQIEHIQHTISLMDNKYSSDKIDNLVKANLQKCANWCASHDVPQNTFTVSSNHFLDSARDFG
jgi:23S rRNA U2552 (ribose-2'-O)-methylase RlmE/FtsJ